MRSIRPHDLADRAYQGAGPSFRTPHYHPREQPQQVLRIVKIERCVARPVLDTRLDRTTVGTDLNLPQPPSVRPELHQEDPSLLELRPAQVDTAPSHQDGESGLPALGTPLSAETGQRIRIRSVKVGLLHVPTA
ncbi:hypothetical protein [Streptomyces sp. NPDC058326]|uniref:hypothetical protein n=1 Tax=Streptomyces sp. NPDC058326 TaxID=3346447 RepID=UPI0036EE33C1